MRATSMQQMPDWSRFEKMIRPARRFVLTSHVRPDCDALGSELGMALILESLGKQVRIVNGQETPARLAFIDPQRRIETLGTKASAADVADTDVLMILDTSAWAQLGSMADVVRATTAKKILLDHHVSEDDLGAEAFKDVTAEATGRLVLQAAQHLGVALTAEIAKPLFAAIATDTGWFRFASATAETYRHAAALIDAGVAPSEMYRELYEQDTLSRLNLIGRTLARARTDQGGRIIYTAVFLDDFEATGAHPSETEDIVNMTLTVGRTEVAVILVQQAPARFKISFRSRSDVDCSLLAHAFGGGGHRAAAGAIVEGPFADVQEQVLDAVRRAMA